MYININVSDDLISGSYGKDQFVVRFTKERYDKMIELQQKANAVKQYSDLKGIFEEFMPLTEESFKDLVETRCPYIVVNDITKEFFLLYNLKLSILRVEMWLCVCVYLYTFFFTFYNENILLNFGLPFPSPLLH